jgi:rubrerythrin
LSKWAYKIANGTLTSITSSLFPWGVICLYGYLVIPASWLTSRLRSRNALPYQGVRHHERRRQSLDYLNRSLRSELTAINQYWLHYRIFDNWGFKELAKKWREESIEEMHHADRFVSRILFLEGFPNLQVLDPLRIGQTVEEIIRCDLAAEISARALYT